MSAAPPGWAEMWKTAVAAAAERNAVRRKAVFSRPGLAKKLTEPPLDYARPNQWTGYIPPRRWGEQQLKDGSTRAMVNDSPRREVLVQICLEAGVLELDGRP